MGQLALTRIEWCDFIVNFREDYRKERIYIDQDKWGEMKEKLDKFYFEVFLPQVVKQSSK